MLRVFFLLVAYLTDYRAVADALHSGVTLGLANAVLLGFAGAWLVVRGWRMSRGQRDRDVAAPGTLPETRE